VTEPIEDIAKRQARIAAMGARAAFHWFRTQAEIPGTPMWSHQEKPAEHVLTESDFAVWDRLWPAPDGEGA
jgi:hypothetical protein